MWEWDVWGGVGGGGGGGEGGRRGMGGGCATPKQLFLAAFSCFLMFVSVLHVLAKTFYMLKAVLSRFCWFSPGVHGGWVVVVGQDGGLGWGLEVGDVAGVSMTFCCACNGKITGIYSAFLLFVLRVSCSCCGERDDLPCLPL